MTLDPELNANLVKSEIEKLSSAKYTKDMDLPNCPVCLDEFVEEQEIRILSCRHGFHKECIDAWLIHTLKCPICRKSVSSMSEAPQFEIYQTYYYV
ncbi:hypothetical protein PAEPH01_2226 [Pancytospora epiphaga]|nr:hypothetical protein PAEPH01_2226 [Pancytospora epiphaga]